MELMEPKPGSMFKEFTCGPYRKDCSKAPDWTPGLVLTDPIFPDLFPETANSIVKC